MRTNMDGNKMSRAVLTKRLSFHGSMFFTPQQAYCKDCNERLGQLTFMGHSGSNSSAFYTNRVTFVGLSRTPR